MADADKSLKIHVETTANVSGLKSAEQATKQAAGASAELNKTYKDYSEKEVNKVLGAQAKQTESIRTMRNSMRALALQVPVLGRLTQVVFSGIGSALVGIIGAQTIWNRRMEEARKTLANTELPDLTKLDPVRIRDAAKAWGSYAEAINQAKEAMGGMEARAEATLEAIKQQWELMKELGGDTPLAAKYMARREALEKFRQAANLRIRQRQRVEAAAGLHPMDALDEERLAGDLEAIRFRRDAPPVLPGEARGNHHPGDTLARGPNPFLAKLLVHSR